MAQQPPYHKDTKIVVLTIVARNGIRLSLCRTKWHKIVFASNVVAAVSQEIVIVTQQKGYLHSK